MLGGKDTIRRGDREEGVITPAFVGSESNVGSCFTAAMGIEEINYNNMCCGVSFSPAEAECVPEHLASQAAPEGQHCVERGNGCDE